MKLICLPEVDSTNSYAETLIEKGQPFPFAVQAGLQTQGKGRRGRQFASPAGGLYLTMAVPGQHFKGVEHLIPLWTATTVCCWLKEHLQVTPEIKWPNDLLLGRKKLGGILCEASIRGQSWQHTLIGIGLNLTLPPKELQPIATGLNQYLNAPIAATPELTTYFVAFFEQCLGVEDKLTWLQQTHPYFALPENQVWLDENGKAWWQKNLDWGSGALILERQIWPETPKELTTNPQQYRQQTSLQSAHHSFQWQKPKAAWSPLLADIGNSSLKLAYWQQGKWQKQSFLHAENWQGMPSFLKEYRTHLQSLGAENCLLPIKACSVQPEISSALRLRFLDAGFDLQHAPKRWRWIKGSHYDIDQLGSDRLMACDGFAMQLQTQATHPMSSYNLHLVIQHGTMLTIDALTQQGEHLGGFILPGLYILEELLQQKGQQLPAWQPIADPLTKSSIWGRNTQEAMQHGCHSFYAAFFSQLILSQQAQGNSIAIALTGGDHERIKAQLPKKVAAFHFPDLIFERLLMD